MWEVRGQPDHLADLIAWVCETALQEVEQSPLHVSSDVYSSAENRVVVISKWRGSPVPMPDPPSRLVARPAHFWDFTEVDR
jgi:hypothetical protein